MLNIVDNSLNKQLRTLSGIKGWCSIGLAMLLVGCGTKLPVESAPDLILHNAKVITVDSNFAIREAVAIDDGRIQAVGNNDKILRLAGQQTKIVDLGGKTVTPGFIDSHIHAFGYGLHISKHLMFSTGEPLTVAEMVEQIRIRANNTPPGEWIYSRGPYSLDFVAEGRLPTRAEVDAVTPHNPFFMNMQGHVGVVNSQAMRLAGINKETPDPKGGTFVRDPETGELTGLIYEFPAFHPFVSLIPGYSVADQLNAVREANDVFNRLGLTSVVNLWMTWDEWEVLRQLARDGGMTVRWATMLKTRPQDFLDISEAQVEEKIRAIKPATDAGDEWLKINGIKIIFDGFVEAAYMHEPYLENTFGEGWRGIPLWNRESLKSVLRASAKHNIQVTIHAAGDAALEQVLNVLDEVDAEHALAGRRWTLEHAGVIPTEKNIDIAKRLKLIISTQQAMGWSIGKSFKKFWGHDRGAMFAPNQTWLTALGHPYVKAGSDNRPVNPFIGFWAYLTREDVDGEVSLVEEVLNREDTMRLYTINGAYGIFDENSKGSIEVGKLADLVVLSEDILTVDESKIKDILPVMTIVDGEIMYSDNTVTTK